MPKGKPAAGARKPRGVTVSLPPNHQAVFESLASKLPAKTVREALNTLVQERLGDSDDFRQDLLDSVLGGLGLVGGADSTQMDLPLE